MWLFLFMTDKQIFPKIPCLTCSMEAPLKTDRYGRAHYWCKRCLCMVLSRWDTCSNALRGIAEMHKMSGVENFSVKKIQIPRLGKWICPTCGSRFYSVENGRGGPKKLLMTNKYKYYCRDCGLLIFWNSVIEDVLAAKA